MTTYLVLIAAAVLWTVLYGPLTGAWWAATLVVWWIARRPAKPA
jgi:hypothetical protein